MDNYIYAVFALAMFICGFCSGYLIRWRQLRIRYYIELMAVRRRRLNYKVISIMIEKMTSDINSVKFDHPENKPENL